MDDVIALGIHAKHSNEDGIAPYEQWIERYGDRIGLLGGIDLDILCVKTPDEVYDIVLERGHEAIAAWRAAMRSARATRSRTTCRSTAISP